MLGIEEPKGIGGANSPTLKLGNVTYVLRGKQIVWYLNEKQDGIAKYDTEAEAAQVFDEMGVSYAGAGNLPG